jgi:hypothetical protein
MHLTHAWQRFAGLIRQGKAGFVGQLVDADFIYVPSSKNLAQIPAKPEQGCLPVDIRGVQISIQWLFDSLFTDKHANTDLVLTHSIKFCLENIL